MKKRIIKIFSIISVILSILVTLIRFFAIQGYIAAITRNFSYLDKLSISENEKNLIMQNSMPINGFLNLVLLALGLLIIITLIINNKNYNNRSKFIIPYILMISYGVIEIINILITTPVDYTSILGGGLFIFLGSIPILIILWLQNKE